MLTHKNIVLGVCGSIAAYKAAELARLLIKQHANVKVIMTPCATHFIQPLTFEAITGHKVALDDITDSMQHIDLARWADIFLIAPASAATLAKLAHGLCDNILTTTCLACNKSIYLAPAMNLHMWQHPSTQHNIKRIKEFNYVLLGPAEGSQACGDVGLGRMLEPSEIIQELQNIYSNQATKIKVLITAGPTQEAIDPIRYLSNRSSGKMGFALAKAFANFGAKVTVIHGPTQIEPPYNTHNIKVVTAEDMHHSVMQQIEAHDVFVATAAVADYKPASYHPNKIKKSHETLTLNLVKNPDILATIGQVANKPFTVGFAAETNNLLINAKQKLRQKNADMIIANLISEPHNPFNADQNAVYILQPNQDPIFLPLESKAMIANKIVRRILAILQETIPS